jgi:monoamine oxidase
MFDLNQRIFIVDPETGYKEQVAMASMEELPEVISAISNEQHINQVLFSGNSIFGKTISEDVVTYSKLNYNNNEIKVEVLK